MPIQQSNVSARVLRWALEVQKYTMDIQYVAGKANAVADALVRGAIEANVPREQVYVEEEMIICSTCKGWLAELKKDPDYSRVIADIMDRKLDKVVQLPRCSRKLLVADFTVDNGELEVREDGRSVVVVLRSRRKALFDGVHSGVMAGNLNGRKLLRKLKRSVFWEGMDVDTARWSNECRECFLSRPHQKHVPPLKPITTSTPYELIGVGLVEFGLSALAQDGRIVDNSALTIFYCCSGRRFEEDDPVEFKCRVRQSTFSAVAHVEDPIIANLSFRSIFELARLMSILESEADLERKRYKMKNPTHCFITFKTL
ncbi:hypothetical protein ANCCAN_22772 [Ancylostoma caninum]|uniref:RNA-directed DNA polymerase n=1 Tax=Ancylostoma caninum TaxID=29170 RepID=A0A368FGT1_ANCCA|nr:hypothetical protein ANCCAN_22772 [Ancylostoma caninum]